jgi:hypothetical protein
MMPPDRRPHTALPSANSCFSRSERFGGVSLAIGVVSPGIASGRFTFAFARLRSRARFGSRLPSSSRRNSIITSAVAPLAASRSSLSKSIFIRAPVYFSLTSLSLTVTELHGFSVGRGLLAPVNVTWLQSGLGVLSLERHWDSMQAVTPCGSDHLGTFFQGYSAPC